MPASQITLFPERSDLAETMLQTLADELDPQGQLPVRTVWTPQDGPQAAAYLSKADIIGYGGAAGGGKTDLALGFAATKHYRSIIFRRVFPLLEAIEARSREIINREGVSRISDTYNESLHRWELENGAIIRFAAIQRERDKQNYQGRPYDFYAFDEATEFTETQFRFVTGWNRSTRPGQTCRVLLTFNPPMDDGGEWVVNYFAPWLDETYSNPAKDGELRWYAMLDGKETEVKHDKAFRYKGETITPKSRTFFHAKLSDNPILEKTGYSSTIDAMPEPLRSIMRGNFNARKTTDPFQIIPTDWVRDAQKRWLETDKPNIKNVAVGVDPSRGGKDKTAIALRFDNWYNEVKTWEGEFVKDGAIVAELVRQTLEKLIPVYLNIDVTGIGSSGYDHLKPMFEGKVNPFNPAEGSDYRDKSGKLKMRNKRAEMYWRMRDALDPKSGEDVCLPPSRTLLVDLCSARYKVTSAGVLVEEKEEIKKRIGRSPDEGEAVMMANINDLSNEDLGDLGRVEDFTNKWS